MARRRKRKKKTDAPSPRKQSGSLDRRLATFWTQRIRAGLEAQKHYKETAEEVAQFLKNSHRGLFDHADTQDFVLSAQGSAVISVPLVPQMRNSLAPRLTYAKPHRELTPTTGDGVMIALARVLEEYLNYTARECNLARHTRKSVSDGLIRGRAFLQQVYNSNRNLVHSRYLSSLNVVFDPDFDSLEEAKWVAVRYKEPFWETERRISEKWRYKKLKYAPELQTGAEAQNIDGEPSDENGVPQSADRLTYWVVYSKMGRGIRGTKFLQEGEKKSKDNQDYVRLEIVLDHEVPLAEGDWEVPLYLDEGWPLAYTDYNEPLDEPWPESTAGQVMPLQKGIDLLATARFNSAINRDRLVILVDDTIAKVEQHRIKNGTMAEILSIKKDPGTPLSTLVHVVEFGQGDVESAQERAYLEEQVEKTTGVTQVLTGGADTGAQDRSATASQMRNEAAGARVADLKQRTDELSTDAARNEAIIVRLMLEPEDVEPYVRAEHIGMFFVSVEVPGAGVIQVRDLSDTPRQEEEEDNRPLTLADLSPGAATYFMNPEDAHQAALGLVEDLKVSEDPRVIGLANVILGGGVTAEEDGLPMAVSIAPVTVERVWEDTAGMTAEEVMREMSYEIAAGSSVPINKEAKQAYADKVSQTVLPIALQAGDFETANQIIGMAQDSFDVPLDERVELSPPPPPQPGMQGPSQ